VFSFCSPSFLDGLSELLNDSWQEKQETEFTESEEKRIGGSAQGVSA
jgi:hypothetical protein